MRYIAGFNQPGYTPESDPVEFDEFEEARDYHVEEIDNAADDAVDDEEGDALADFGAEVADEKGPSFSLLGPDGYAYWVMCEK